MCCGRLGRVRSLATRRGPPVSEGRLDKAPIGGLPLPIEAELRVVRLQQDGPQLGKDAALDSFLEAVMEGRFGSITRGQGGPLTTVDQHAVVTAYRYFLDKLLGSPVYRGLYAGKVLLWVMQQDVDDQVFGGDGRIPAQTQRHLAR